MPLGANSHARASACMMNGTSPRIVAVPVASGGGRYEGGRSTMKSGTSAPVHLFAAASHHTYFLRSLHGVPSGAAEARLYMIRRFAGHAQPHSGATTLCCDAGFLRAV